MLEGLLANIHGTGYWQPKQALISWEAESLWQSGQHLWQRATAEIAPCCARAVAQTKSQQWGKLLSNPAPASDAKPAQPPTHLHQSWPRLETYLKYFNSIERSDYAFLKSLHSQPVSFLYTKICILSFHSCCTFHSFKKKYHAIEILEGTASWSCIIIFNYVEVLCLKLSNYKFVSIVT